MAASYKKLFKLLIDREMKSKDLAAKAGVSTVTLAKMKKDGAADGFINIPLDSLRERVGQLDKSKKIYVMCQSGLRVTWQHAF